MIKWEGEQGYQEVYGCEHKDNRMGGRARGVSRQKERGSAVVIGLCFAVGTGTGFSVGTGVGLLC
jgi:hypothetical protein